MKALPPIACAFLVCTAGFANAAPTLRTQLSQRGDFILIGNTLGHDCGAGVPMPVAGTLGACGNQMADTSPDVFWRADAPALGQATADNTIVVADARSTAMLSLPAGSAVTHAYLYWAARTANMTGDMQVTLDRPGGFTSNVMANGSVTTVFGGNFYQSYADITTLVQTQGPGPYRLSGVDSVNLVGLNDAQVSAGWWMVVLYENANEPLRNIAVFDGLDQVIDGGPATITVSGFAVPVAAYDAKLGVIAYDGDDQAMADSFLWNGNAISDALNPATNIFNSSRTFLGNPVSITGDLPQLTGGPRSMSGIDLDVFDITNKLVPGETSANIEAMTVGDNYVLGGVITSISIAPFSLGAACNHSDSCASEFCDAGTCACDNDVDCPAGQVCNISASPNACIPAGCGNGVIEVAEGCDDGNTTSGDGCNSACKLEIGQLCIMSSSCASGFCDSTDNTCACDSNTDCPAGKVCNTSASPNACVPGGCGNGVLEAAEGCDDGNTTPNDGCNAACLLELNEECTASGTCASGFCDPDVSQCKCDDSTDCPSGQSCNTAATPNACVPIACGNGVLEMGEGCDDGNTMPGDGCNATCLIELGIACTDSASCESGLCDATINVCTCDENDDCPLGQICDITGTVNECMPGGCGNGFLAPDEECDDGNANDDDGCDSNCTSTACGNGIQTTGEECDDGNSIDNDDCSNACLVNDTGNANSASSSSSGGGGAGGNPIAQEAGCDCSMPGKIDGNRFVFALLATIVLQRRRKARHLRGSAVK